MTYETSEMILFGCEEQKRFLNELQERFGKDASLECVLQKLSQENALPIEQCKFTGVAVYNNAAYELAGDNKEFTGTIKEILKELYIDLSDEEDEEDEGIIDGLVEMFCAKYWVDSIGPNKDLNVRCAPIDRAVTEEEVTAYLEKLAAEEE